MSSAAVATGALRVKLVSLRYNKGSKIGFG